MFRLLKKDIFLLLNYPKFYLALVIGSIQFIINSNLLVEFSKYLNEPLNIVDCMIYCLSSKDTILISLFSLVFVFSDMPLDNFNMDFQIIRMNKAKWIYLKIQLILSTIIIYSVFNFIITCIIALPYSYFGNLWSVPMHTLNTNVLLGVSFGTGLYYNNINLIRSFSPIMVFIISFLLFILYIFLMSLIVIFFNMKVSKGVGIGVIVFIRGVEFFIELYVTEYIGFSLFNHSIMANHNFNLADKLSNAPLLWHTFTLYILIAIVLINLILKQTNKFDLS